MSVCLSGFRAEAIRLPEKGDGGGLSLSVSLSNVKGTTAGVLGPRREDIWGMWSCFDRNLLARRDGVCLYRRCPWRHGREDAHDGGSVNMGGVWSDGEVLARVAYLSVYSKKT